MKKLILLVSLLSTLNIFSMEEKPVSQKLSCFNYVKNKTTSALKYISNTVKSDMGILNKLEENPSPPYSLTKDFAAGCRLYCYNFAAQVIINSVFKQVVDLKDLPPQFVKAQPLFDTCIRAPIFEEALMTYVLSRVVGLKCCQVITPLIFGYLHHHDNPKRWMFNAAHLAPLSYFSVRYYLTRGQEESSLAPIFHHMIHNAVSSYITRR